mmetsp:Transcript_12279/g.28187  ORF Transcript_12279/g.28187 Transcript_12279/m.28187 type:complete len:156 (+) Transcript_12279:3-470(+)
MMYFTGGSRKPIVESNTSPISRLLPESSPRSAAQGISTFDANWPLTKLDRDLLACNKARIETAKARRVHDIIASTQGGFADDPADCNNPRSARGVQGIPAAFEKTWPQRRSQIPAAGDIHGGSRSARLLQQPPTAQSARGVAPWAREPQSARGAK